MSYTGTTVGTRYDLSIVRNTTFARTITYKVNGTTTDITGYTFAAQVRTLTGVLARTITCTIIDAANGLFQIALSDADTNALVLGEYVWSLEVTIGSATSELLRGSVYMVDEVTRGS